MPRGRMHLPVVELRGNAIGASILLNFNGTFHLEYGAADPRYYKCGVEQILIWEAIRKARSAGASYFDFGRTHLAHSSLIEFKERWGAKPRTLVDYGDPGFVSASAGMNPGKRLLARINRGLPNFLLDWQGILVYRLLS